ncbi:MAG TPA: GMC family oxidoreductase N-terminal domain-containing protein [Polyangiaceae bacterium]|jgi:choline dehydrogenase
MHDYVVVGAGSAGCVLARRLSDDPKCRVLLVEAGAAKHGSLRVRAPSLYQLLWRTPLDWSVGTAPQKHAGGRRMYWPRGKVLGGTSCLNAMVYVRGHRDNYDEWRDLGNAGWGYDDVLPYFTRSEDNARGASAYHGAGGPLHVSDCKRGSPISDAFAEAVAKHCGVPVTDDFNGASQEGAGRYQVTMRDGVRVSTAAAFLDPVRGRPNLEIATGVHVTGVVVRGGRARGVRGWAHGRQQTFEASREVILCAGAIGSPHILLLSGIGPARELRAAGVDVVADLPGVGKNLQDHLLAGVVMGTDSPACKALTVPALLGWVLRYVFDGDGQCAVAPVEAGAFVRSSPSMPRPDVQYHFIPWGLPEPNTDEKRDPPPGRRFSILPGLIYPRSAGEVRLAGRDPLAPPVVDPDYFADEADLDHLVRGIHQARAIAATEPLASYGAREIFPGPGCASDVAIRAAVRATCNTLFHPVGTCRMGPDADETAVVDPSLRVRGIEGLRVADASIMPRIVGGNTNAPVIMIAEKAADLLRDE